MRTCAFVGVAIWCDQNRNEKKKLIIIFYGKIASLFLIRIDRNDGTKMKIWIIIPSIYSKCYQMTRIIYKDAIFIDRSLNKRTTAFRFLKRRISSQSSKFLKLFVEFDQFEIVRSSWLRLCLLREKENWKHTHKHIQSSEMFTLRNVVFSLGIVLLIGLIECKPQAASGKPKVRLNFRAKMNKWKEIWGKQLKHMNDLF